MGWDYSRARGQAGRVEECCCPLRKSGLRLVWGKGSLWLEIEKEGGGGIIGGGTPLPAAKPDGGP